VPLLEWRGEGRKKRRAATPPDLEERRLSGKVNASGNRVFSLVMGKKKEILSFAEKKVNQDNFQGGIRPMDDESPERGKILYRSLWNTKKRENLRDLQDGEKENQDQVIARFAGNREEKDGAYLVVYFEKKKDEAKRRGGKLVRKKKGKNSERFPK